MLNKFRNAIVTTAITVAILFNGISSIDVEDTASTIISKVLFMSFACLVTYQNIILCRDAIKEAEQKC